MTSTAIYVPVLIHPSGTQQKGRQMIVNDCCFLNCTFLNKSSFNSKLNTKAEP